MRRITLALLVSLALAGCGRVNTAESPTTALIAEETAVPEANETASSNTERTPPPRPRGSIDLVAATPLEAAQAAAPAGIPIASPLSSPLDMLVADAQVDLAQRSNLAPEAIEVVEVLAVTWPDGSLGCPRAGMVYPQVQVDGVLVRLRAGEQLFEYHGDGAQPLFLCEGKKGG